MRYQQEQMIIFSETYKNIAKFRFREFLASTCSSLPLPRNDYSKITGIFSKIVNQRAHSEA